MTIRVQEALIACAQPTVGEDPRVGPIVVQVSGHDAGAPADYLPDLSG